MDTDSVSISAVIGVVGALLTVIIKLFDVIASWKKSRESERRSAHEIDQAIKDVDFFNRWLDAVKKTTNEQEWQARREVALTHLDLLMHGYRDYRDETAQPVEPPRRKGNAWFYVISVFLLFGILGLFVDDNGEFSLQYFSQNLDQDTLIGFGFIFLIWVYFLINSRFFDRIRNR